MRRLPALLIAGLALAAPLRAHDTYLVAARSFVDPESSMRLDLTSGMAFPALEYAIKADRVQTARGRLGGATFALAEAPAAKSLAFTAPVAGPGVATLWVELAPKGLSLNEKQVREYVEEIGAPDSIRAAWEKGKPKRWREIYTKHAKAFVAVGKVAGDRSWAEPTGMSFELVPENDPTALHAGDALTVRLLERGEPVAGLAVGLVHAGGAKGELRKTDAAGRVTFRLDKVGRWLLRATELRASARQGTDWESDFTTVTFEVR